MKQTNTSGDQPRYSQMTRDEHLRAFKRLTIEHPHFVATSQALQNAIRETCDASQVFVCGPVGVGKTAMKNHAMSSVVAEILQASRHGEERTPILSLLAKPPLNGSFNLRDFLQNAHSVFETLIDRKVVFDPENNEENMRLTQPGEFLPKNEHRERTNVGALRTSLESL